MRRTVVIFGATGYVGEYLVDELLGRGHEVVAVARSAALPREGVRALADDRLDTLRGRDVVVVNLAYPRAVPGLEIRAANERLLERVRRAVEATGASRLVHTSTQAVFGYEWREVPTRGAAPLVLGDSYIESKRHAEDALRRHQRRRGHDIAIVRLGNILGAGAMPWVTGVAQRILEGRPVAARAGRGRLNGTFVRNIVDYLGALIEHEGRLADGAPGVFHHLAEFTQPDWAALAEPMSNTIGVRALYREDVPSAARAGLKTIIGSAVRRFAEPLARTGAVTLVQRFRPPPAVHAFAPTAEDPGWYVVTAGDIAFPPALLDSWQPPHGFDAMLREICEWLPARGYTLHADLA